MASLGDRIKELRKKYGYEKELYRDEVTPEYERDIQTYVVPSTVTKIGEMCFNYANLRVIYLPEGLETIENVAFAQSGLSGSIVPPPVPGFDFSSNLAYKFKSSVTIASKLYSTVKSSSVYQPTNV